MDDSAPVPRIALNQTDAARALGLSVNHFKRHVRPYLRAIYLGDIRRYAVTELKRWADEKSKP